MLRVPLNADDKCIGRFRSEAEESFPIRSKTEVYPCAGPKIPNQSIRIAAGFWAPGPPMVQ
jgi:hypothetical protein